MDVDVDVDVETTDREIDSSTHLRIKCERSNFTTLYSKFPLVAGICSDTLAWNNRIGRQSGKECNRRGEGDDVLLSQLL